MFDCKLFFRNNTNICQQLSSDSRKLAPFNLAGENLQYTKAEKAAYAHEKI
jgi:hypothetical protein